MKSSDFVHWIKNFEDFPLFTPKPAPMDDSDIEFHSDVQYLHLLLDDIWENAYYSGGTLKLDPVFIDFMATMSAAMNAMTKDIAVSNAALNLFLVDWRESIKAVTL
jgi:hypothetical protein